MDPAFLTIDDKLYIEFKNAAGADYPTLHARDGSGKEYNLNNRHRTVIVETAVGASKTVTVEVSDAKAELVPGVEVRGVFLNSVSKSKSYATNCSTNAKCKKFTLTVSCADAVSYAAFHVITTRGTIEHVGDPLVIVVPKDGSCKED